MRSIDRALGRANNSAAGAADFSTRAFGISKAEAAAIAAAAPAAPGSGSVSGTTGSGGGSNMTSSSYGFTGASSGRGQRF